MTKNYTFTNKELETIIANAVAQAMKGISGTPAKGKAKASAPVKSKTTASKKVANKAPVKGKGNVVATAKKKTIKDFEPVRGADGHYVWNSYKAQRKHYCYYKATNGVATSSNECFKKGIDFSDIKDAYNKAKAEYSKKYVYTTLENR